MKKVIAYEYRSNNSQQKTVAKLECGHERVFEYGYYPKDALCWVCERVREVVPKVEG
jgi:hypothetical protein